MPGFDPKRTYQLALDCFEDVPAKERPVFVYRRINGREYTEIAASQETQGRSLAEQTDAIYSALKIGLVDWKCQTNPTNDELVAFDLERIADILDPVDANQLLTKRLLSARPYGADLKNSEPQS